MDGRPVDGNEGRLDGPDGRLTDGLEEGLEDGIDGLDDGIEGRLDGRLIEDRLGDGRLIEGARLIPPPPRDIPPPPRDIPPPPRAPPPPPPRPHEDSHAHNAVSNRQVKLNVILVERFIFLIPPRERVR